MVQRFILSTAFLASILHPSLQHARLMEPPSRASMWRVGFPTPQDIDDNQSYCGGFGVQYGPNQGRCGICGDPWNQQTRAHEAPGGIYATGIIVKTYKQGSYIPVIIDITANHQGYFIFKLCPNNDVFQDPGQECFDHTPLWVGGGDPAYNYTRFPIQDYETGLRMVYVRLPPYITCEQCILQWTYVAGNNWGKCDNGTGAIGCGPQEHFRSCADIEIVPHPLLQSLELEAVEEFQPLLENDLDFEAEISELHHQKKVSIRRKEALLKRKKLLLKQLIKKLRLLIHQSSEDAASDQMTSPQRPVKSQILPPEFSSSDFNSVRPWWDRILSNKH